MSNPSCGLMPERCRHTGEKMLSSALPLRTLLLAIFVLMAGSGFLSTLIAIRLELAGASALLIGLVATSYFGGLMVGSLRVEKVIARIGHIRAFAAFRMNSLCQRPNPRTIEVHKV